MSDPEIPQFRIPNEGEPIPPADPEDVKRNWKIQPGDKEALIAERARGLDSSAISKRCWMIRVLTGCFNHGQLLAPWKHGVELDDAVFRVAATFPIRPLRQHIYKVAGDTIYGFDPNAFVQKLIEETGISHTWEPVLATMSEGCYSYSFIRVGSGAPTLPPPPDSEREVRQKISELLWAVWSKCQPNLSRPDRKIPGELAAMSVAMRFADFTIDNVDLARAFVSLPQSGETRDRLAILLEMEQRALFFFRRP